MTTHTGSHCHCIQTTKWRQWGQWVHCGQWTVCWEDNNWATLTQLRRNYKDDRWRKTFTLLTFLRTRRSDRILVSDCTVCHDSLWLRDINKLYTLYTLLLLHPIYTKRPIPARRTQSGHSYLVQGPRSSAVNVPTTFRLNLEDNRNKTIVTFTLHCTPVYHNIDSLRNVCIVQSFMEMDLNKLLGLRELAIITSSTSSTRHYQIML